MTTKDPLQNDGDMNKFPVESEVEVEMTDEEVLMEIPLDLIVRELKRRNCPIVYANSIGMLARIIVIPASLEVTRAQTERAIWREKVRERIAQQSEARKRGMVLSSNGQGVSDLHSEGTNASEGGITGRPNLQLSSPESAVGVQGGIRSSDPIPAPQIPPTTGTPGV